MEMCKVCYQVFRNLANTGCQSWLCLAQLGHFFKHRIAKISITAQSFAYKFNEFTYTTSISKPQDIISMPLSGLFNKKGKSKTTTKQPRLKASSPAIQQLSLAQQQQRTDHGYQLLGNQNQKKTEKKALGVVLNCQI
ncbi:unnamed protein product [Umbelopsis ramanniana]